MPSKSEEPNCSEWASTCTVAFCQRTHSPSCQIHSVWGMECVAISVLLLEDEVRPGIGGAATYCHGEARGASGGEELKCESAKVRECESNGTGGRGMCTRGRHPHLMKADGAPRI